MESGLKLKCDYHAKTFFLLITDITLSFLPMNIPEVLKYMREREGMYWIGVRIDQGMIEKRREREKHNEKC